MEVHVLSEKQGDMLPSVPFEPATIAFRSRPRIAVGRSVPPPADKFVTRYFGKGPSGKKKIKQVRALGKAEKKYKHGSQSS